MIGASSIGKYTGMGFAGHALGLGMNIAGEKMGSPETSMGEAVAKGAFWFGADMLVKGASWIPLVAMGVQAGYSAYDDHKKYGQNKIQKYYRSGFGGNFQDTQQAYTMRQRGVQQMQQSKLNARNVLGSEARTLHRSYNGY